jgi:hypothetical protein
VSAIKDSLFTVSELLAAYGKGQGRILVQAKADVNTAQPDGATALAWAVHLGERIRTRRGVAEVPAARDRATSPGRRLMPRKPK